MTKLKEQSWTGTFPASKQLMGTIPGRMVALFKGSLSTVWIEAVKEIISFSDELVPFF
ncbi:hypothetical protein [Pediococcus acidilactici]|uniref:hypothetical protein n=1 Tax=Pediococcus acidilactici TaxID=1254 RepID=UPI0022E45193|nr:hypothetical protein [Pediococcus acidilactici]